MIIDNARSWRVVKIKKLKKRRRSVTVKTNGSNNSLKCIKRDRIR